MIHVWLDADGNINYGCSKCELKWMTPINLASSIFWDIYVGRDILTALGHFRDVYKSI